MDRGARGPLVFLDPFSIEDISLVMALASCIFFRIALYPLPYAKYFIFCSCFYFSVREGLASGALYIGFGLEENEITKVLF